MSTIRGVLAILTLCAQCGVATACSPPSPERKDAYEAFFRASEPRYQFSGLVVGEAVVEAPSTELHYGPNFKALRVRIVQSFNDQLPVGKEFSFYGASVGAACGPTPRPFSLNEFPTGTLLHLGSHDLRTVWVLTLERRGR